MSQKATVRVCFIWRLHWGRICFWASVGFGQIQICVGFWTEDLTSVPCWLLTGGRLPLPAAWSSLYGSCCHQIQQERESANKMEVTCFCNLIMDLTSWLFFAGLKQGKGLFCTRKEEIVPECKDQEVWGSLGATLESAHPKMFPPHTFTYFFLLNVWSLSSVPLLHRSFVIVVSVYIPWLILLWLNVSKTFLM